MWGHLYELNTIKNQAIVQLMSQGISQEKANDLLNQSQSGMIDENGIRIFILETITVQVSAGIIVPNAKEGQARFGQEQLDIDATSNIVIDAVTKMGQIKQKVDQRIVDSNINPQYVGLALGLVLGGPANLVKSVAVDQFFGDEITEITDQVKSNGTAYLLNTDSETVNNTLNNKALINQTGNETAQQLVDQLEWTKEGIGVASSIVLGGVGGAAGKSNTAKIDGKDVDVSTAGLERKQQIEKNRVAGEEYEQKVYDTVKNEMPDVVKQITVKTDSGTRTRIDLIGTDKSGKIVCIECKASDTAPLTKNQKKAFPEISESGATIVGKGKDSFSGGTKIPPTNVIISRPDSTSKK